VKLDKLMFTLNLDVLGSKVLSLKIMDFDDVSLTKFIHFYMSNKMSMHYKYDGK
jgi:hypothetical protein